MSISIARWLKEARELLEEAHGRNAEPVEVVVRRGRASVAFTIESENGDNGTPAIALSPIERQILLALGDGPLTAKSIARRVDHPYDSALRVILANLCEREPPVLRSSRDGYIRVG